MPFYQRKAISGVLLVYNRRIDSSVRTYLGLNQIFWNRSKYSVLVVLSGLVVRQRELRWRLLAVVVLFVGLLVLRAEVVWLAAELVGGLLAEVVRLVWGMGM